MMQPLVAPFNGRSALAITARHPQSSRSASHSRIAPKQAKNKSRDISTSFRRGPVPRPLIAQQPAVQQQQQQQQVPQQPQQQRQLGQRTIRPQQPPPAAAAAASAIAPPSVGPSSSLSSLLLGGSGGDQASRHAVPMFEPVVAAAAAALAAPLAPPQPAAGAGAAAGGAAAADGLLWAADADPLASMDRVLDSLIVAPAPTPSGASGSSSGSRSTSKGISKAASSSRRPAGAAARSPSAAVNSPAASSAPAAASAAPSSSSSDSPLPCALPALSAAAALSMAGAPAGPAVIVIHNEADYERELAAAAALRQLLVVKVESSSNLLQGGLDSSLRFQTHTNLPTPLNTYLPNEMHGAHMGMLGSGGSSSSSMASGGLSTTAEVLHSLGFPLSSPAAPAGSSSSSYRSSSYGSSSYGSSSFASCASSSSSSSGGGEPFSPMHAWYKQLASKYAHAAAAKAAAAATAPPPPSTSTAAAAPAGRLAGWGAAGVSPVRFLSLQADSARARAVCRRLGVSAGLSVVLVDAASGRRLQEVCGTRIEQELPNGLLYFGGSDPQGCSTAARLAQLGSERDLQRLTSSAQLSVVAFTMHAAPPCIRAYARLYAVAQQHAAAPPAALAFGVLDVDASPAAAAVGAKLGLEQLPTYVLYSGGEEVARLSTSPDRRRLAAVLAHTLAAAAAAPAAAAAAAAAAPAPASPAAGKGS